MWNVFDTTDMGDNYDLYILSDTLFLADVFENFKVKCIEIYILDPAHFSSAHRLAWQDCLKNKSRIKIINRYWYTIDGEKWVKNLSQLNEKFIKNYDTNIDIG